MSKKVDFELIADRLLRDASRLLPQWLPGGKTVGREYCCGNLRGEPGNSLKVNLETGRWADFADGEKGGDLISLYAAINGCKQIDAAKILSESYVAKSAARDIPKEPFRPTDQGLDLVVPPKGTRLPKFYIPELGEPVARWTYKTSNGSTLFFVTRYNLADGKKEFRPWSFSESKGWVKKYPAKPRPLYNLDQLTSRAGAPVLVVEGEKSAEAASALLGSYYVVTTWPAGGNSWPMSDWSVLYGRTVLVWPDSDQPGIDAADAIAHHLHSNGCSVKILNVVANGGWDVADARDEGYDTERVIAWARERATVFVPRPTPVVEVLPSNVEPIPLPPEPPSEQHIHIYQDADQVPTSLASSFNELWVRSGLTLSGNGQPVINADNASRMMSWSKKYCGHVWYDSFLQDILTDYDGAVRAWTEDDTLRLMIFLQSECGLARMPDHATFAAVKYVSLNNQRDSAREWLSSLSWDGVHRLDGFFATYCGAPNNEYSMIVSRNLFLSIAARIATPGCKVDNMVIIEGRQGARKSSLLNVLGGEWYTDASSGFGTKDFYQQLRGKIIVEISELDLFRKSDVNTIKRVLTTRVDEYRPPYAAKTQAFARRCVFIGTTNQDEYLLDETGNRRFWPITTTNVDIDAVVRDREQLFAEAFARLSSGETWWEIPSDLAEREQSSRLESDPWESFIADHVNRTQSARLMGVSARDILIDCLKFDESRISRIDSIRVGRCLRKLGFDSKLERRDNAVQRIFKQKNSQQNL